jgi:hypothetical protein
MLWLQPKPVKWRWWFKPIGFIIDEVREMLSCPYCLSFHLGWLICYFIIGLPLIQALIYGAIAIIFVELYRKISL